MASRDEEIISTLRRGYDAFSRGEFDTAREVLHPEVEFCLPGGQSPLRGADAVRAWMEPDALEDQRIELRELRINGDKALVLQNTTARGVGSGIELDVDTWAVWTFDDDGLVTRLEAFMAYEQDQALEAAGLSE